MLDGVTARLVLCTLCTLFFAGVYAVASGLMSFHYGDILEEFNSCLLPLLYGSPETGSDYIVRWHGYHYYTAIP